MELTATILSTYLPKEIYIGKSRSECHLAICDYSKGRMTWTMDSTIRSCPSKQSKFYDSFVAFSDFARQVDSMAHQFTTMKENEVKINRFAEMIQKRWPFNSFVLGCAPMLTQDQSFLLAHMGNIMLALKNFFQYDQLSNKRKVDEGLHSMNWFLTKCGVKVAEGKEPIDISDENFIKLMDKIDADYPSQRPKIHAVYHDDGKPTIQTAILLCDRANVSPIAALRYLNEVASMNDSEYVRRAVSEARLIKFQGHLDQ